jgi:hypothetical protein
MTSPNLRFDLLGPGDYDRAKSILNRGKHPGFVGRELFYRCATSGRAVVAVLDEQDVGVALVVKDKLQALNTPLQGRGIGSALMRHLRPRWVSSIEEKVSFFIALGYRRVGEAKVGANGKHATQLLELIESVEAPIVKAPIVEAPIVEAPRSELTCSLLQFVAKLSPEYAEPVHLQGWCETIERCLHEPIRGACSVPIRHFKTQTTLHGIVWLLVRDPTLRVLIMTFDHERAEWLGNESKDLSTRCDSMFGTKIGPERGQNKKIQWSNASGGGVAAMSADQSREGHDVDILVVDDPMTELECDDAQSRDRVDKAISHYTARVGRPGRRGSVLLIMSRLSPDDPMGRRLARTGVVKWESLEFPAIIDLDGPNEHAWAPNVMSLEELKERRAEWAQQDPSERGFFARFQNDPRPASIALFKRHPARYERLPEFGRFRTVGGLDLAYEINPHADFFARVVIRVHENGLAYVQNVLRARRDLRMAAEQLRSDRRNFPGIQFYTYASGPEKGAITYLADEGIHVQWMQARYDKSTRARHTIDAWNNDRIVVPTLASWDLAGFLSRTASFTGLEKQGNDDEQDALVSACDGGLFSAVAAPKAFGKPRIGRY